MNVLTNQEFTYRAVPENYDGTGTLTSVKGNTIVWNQLWSDYTTIYPSTGTVTKNADHDYTFTSLRTGADYWEYSMRTSASNNIVGHKYLVHALIKPSVALTTFTIYMGSGINANTPLPANTFTTANVIITVTGSNSPTAVEFQFRELMNQSVGATVQVKNAMVFDLTQMFGSGNEPTIAEFGSLFPLSYYQFTQGELVSFGHINLFHKSALQIGKNWIYGSASDRAILEFSVKPNTDYHFIASTLGSLSSWFVIYKTGFNTGQISNVDMQQNLNFTVTTPSTCNVICIQFQKASAITSADFVGDFEVTEVGGEVGIKTTGKNLCCYWQDGYIDSNGNRVASAQNGISYPIPLKSGETVVFSAKATGSGRGLAVFSDFFSNLIYRKSAWESGNTITYTATQNCWVAIWYNYDNAVYMSQSYFDKAEVQIEYSTGKTEYEPYIESTLSLPISTYFPDGQMSASTIYDELTGTSYVKRVGMVDLGNLTWTKGGTAFNTLSLASVIKLPPNNSTKPNIVGVNMIPVSSNDDSGVSGSYEVIVNRTTGQLSYRYPMSGIADGSAFATLMSGVYLYYELATPLENYGVVDLGTLDYTYDSGTGSMMATISDIKQPTSDSVVVNALIPIALTISASQRTSVSGKRIYCFGNTSVLYLRDFGYSDTNAFKSAMSGVYLLYELETPSTISLDLTYDTWNGGTEQILPSNTSTPSTSPILTDITYRGLIPVSAIASPYGSGTVTGSGQYRYHETATLNATPNDEIYRFIRYEDENGTVLSTSSTYSFTVGD